MRAHKRGPLTVLAHARVNLPMMRQATMIRIQRMIRSVMVMTIAVISYRMIHDKNNG